VAGLPQIPETTLIACGVLRRVWYRLQSSESFSGAHTGTCKTLLALFYEDSADFGRRANTIDALCDVIASENDDNILSLVNLWKLLVLVDTQPAAVYIVSGLVGELIKARSGVSK
jgi:hypothetical protein